MNEIRILKLSCLKWIYYALLLIREFLRILQGIQLLEYIYRLPFILLLRVSDCIDNQNLIEIIVKFAANSYKIYSTL